MADKGINCTYTIDIDFSPPPLLYPSLSLSIILVARTLLAHAKFSLSPSLFRFKSVRYGRDVPINLSEMTCRAILQEAKIDGHLNENQVPIISRRRICFLFFLFSPLHFSLSLLSTISHPPLSLSTLSPPSPSLSLSLSLSLSCAYSLLLHHMCQVLLTHHDHQILLEILRRKSPPEGEGMLGICFS